MNNTNKVLLGLLVCSAALVAVPPSSAAPGQFGTFVQAYDVDALHNLVDQKAQASIVAAGDFDVGAVLLPTATHTLCFSDLDGNAFYSLGDGLYAAFGAGCPAAVAAVAAPPAPPVDAGPAAADLVRLFVPGCTVVAPLCVASIGQAAGAVQVGDIDIGQPLIALPAGADCDGVFGAPIVACGAHSCVDSDLSGFCDAFEPLYATPAAAPAVAVGQIRLLPGNFNDPVMTNFGSNVGVSCVAFFSWTGAADFECKRATAFAFVDLNSNRAYDSPETMYLKRTCRTGALPLGSVWPAATESVACVAAVATLTVGAQDLRLTSFGALPAYSQVVVTDTDFGAPYTVLDTAAPPIMPPAPVTAMGQVLQYYDFDGDATWSYNDLFYADADQDGRISPSDVRVALPPNALGLTAGTRVLTGNTDEKRVLSQGTAGAPKGHGTIPILSFFDKDRSIVQSALAPYSADDINYIHQYSGYSPNVDSEDLRLGALGTVAQAGAGSQAGFVLQPESVDVVVQTLMMYKAAVSAGTCAGAPTPPWAGCLSDIGAAPVNAPFCFADDNGNNAFDTGETAYFNADGLGAAIAGFDLRLTPKGALPAGSQVSPTAGSEVGSLCKPFPVGTTVSFYDQNGDGLWSTNDAFYVNVAGAATVNAGMIRLTPFGSGATAKASGTRVQSLDPDETRPLTTPACGLGVGLMCIAPRFFDADHNGAYNTGDTVYFHQFIAAVIPNPTIEDFRLNQLGFSTTAVGLGSTSSNFVRYESADIVYTFGPNAGLCGAGATWFCDTVGNLCGTGILVPAQPPTTNLFDFLDDNGNGAYDTGERQYLDWDASQTLTLGDVLISPGASTFGSGVSGTDVPGTQVIGNDPRITNPLSAVACAAPGQYDLDGNAVWSVDDNMYVNNAFTTLGLIVDATDVRLNDAKVSAGGATIGAAGTRVGSGATDESRGLTQICGTDVVAPCVAGPSSIRYFDADRTGTYNVCDLVYLAQTTISLMNSLVEDFRLNRVDTTFAPCALVAPQPPSCPAGQVGTPPNCTTPTTTTAPPTTTTQPTTTTTNPPTTTAKPKTPGFELVALVAALGAALVLVRRKL